MPAQQLLVSLLLRVLSTGIFHDMIREQKTFLWALIFLKGRTREQDRTSLCNSVTRPIGEHSTCQCTWLSVQIWKWHYSHLYLWPGPLHVFNMSQFITPLPLLLYGRGISNHLKCCDTLTRGSRCFFKEDYICCWCSETEDLMSSLSITVNNLWNSTNQINTPRPMEPTGKLLLKPVRRRANLIWDNLSA